MKCPIFTIGRTDVQMGVESDYGECIKEECAWWVKASQSCAMEAIPRIIGYLGSELKTIHENMPTDSQFRR